MSEPPWVVFLIPIVGIIGGFTLAGLSIYAGIRRREFEHRERLAMIERGVAPAAPPSKAEADAGLPTTSDVFGTSQEARDARLRRGGFINIAIGFGLALMIWMTSHESDVAVGVGGFMVILGTAIIVSSFFGRGGHGSSLVGRDRDGSRR